MNKPNIKHKYALDCLERKKSNVTATSRPAILKYEFAQAVLSRSKITYLQALFMKVLPFLFFIWLCGSVIRLNLFPRQSNLHAYNKSIIG